jgi:hypothetical protein
MNALIGKIHCRFILLCRLLFHIDDLTNKPVQVSVGEGSSYPKFGAMRKIAQGQGFMFLSSKFGAAMVIGYHH